MPRIKNHKPIIIILVILLFVLSVSVLISPDMKSIKRVNVKNQNIVIRQGNTNVIHTDVGLNNSGNVENQDLDSLNRDFNVSNSDVNFGSGNSDNINPNGANRGVKISDTGANSYDPAVNPHRLSFQNSAYYKREMENYRYQDINWGTWKSRFVNRILDDSLFIKSLDTYGIGTWFYYSFVVTDTGEIHDVTVFSLYLSEEDKLAIRALIRSYEKLPITIFPANTQRKKAKIKAVMLLGDTEQKANPGNFSDMERVKIRY